MSQQPELLPCPFCGEAVDTDIVGCQGRTGQDPSFAIDCSNADCFLAQYSRGGPKPYDDADQMLTAWNTRTPADVNQRMKTALEKIERWELPASGMFYPNTDGSTSDRPAPYDSAFAHGSEGAKQAIREIAREALQSLEGR